METTKTVKVACPKTKGNETGYYLCNADQVPKGSQLFNKKLKAKVKKEAAEAAAAQKVADKEKAEAEAAKKELAELEKDKGK